MANLNPPAGDPPNPNPAPAGDPPAPTAAELAVQLAETRRQLSAANHESADRRKRLEDMEAAEETRKKAQMSALELAQKEAADAKARADAAEANVKAARAEAEESLLQAALTTRAVALGLDEGEVPTAWLTLRNDSALRAKITAKAGAAPGTFDGVDDVVKQLLKDHPKWAKSPTTKHNINGGDRGGATEPTLQELIERKRAQYAGTL